MRLRLFFAAAAAVLAAAPVAAQQEEGQHAHEMGEDVPRDHADLTEEEAEVMAAVDMLFDGMRARDTAMIRAAFHDEAGLTGPAPMQDGSWGIRSVSADEFTATIGRIPPIVDEPLFNVEVRLDGPLATVWADYDVYLDGEFSHCGVDAFQLANLGDGWKILTVADTRYTEGCKRAPAGG
jgi:hypothetical protein